MQVCSALYTISFVSCGTVHRHSSPGAVLRQTSHPRCPKLARCAADIVDAPCSSTLAPMEQQPGLPQLQQLVNGHAQAGSTQQQVQWHQQQLQAGIHVLQPPQEQLQQQQQHPPWHAAAAAAAARQDSHPQHPSQGPHTGHALAAARTPKHNHRKHKHRHTSKRKQAQPGQVHQQHSQQAQQQQQQVKPPIKYTPCGKKDGLKLAASICRRIQDDRQVLLPAAPGMQLVRTAAMLSTARSLMLSSSSSTGLLFQPSFSDQAAADLAAHAAAAKLAQQRQQQSAQQQQWQQQLAQQQQWQQQLVQQQQEQQHTISVQLWPPQQPAQQQQQQPQQPQPQLPPQQQQQRAYEQYGPAASANGGNLGSFSGSGATARTSSSTSSTSSTSSSTSSTSSTSTSTSSGDAAKGVMLYVSGFSEHQLRRFDQAPLIAGPRGSPAALAAAVFARLCGQGFTTLRAAGPGATRLALLAATEARRKLLGCGLDLAVVPATEFVDAEILVGPDGQPLYTDTDLQDTSSFSTDGGMLGGGGDSGVQRAAFVRVTLLHVVRCEPRRPWQLLPCPVPPEQLPAVTHAQCQQQQGDQAMHKEVQGMQQQQQQAPEQQQQQEQETEQQQQQQEQEFRQQQKPQEVQGLGRVNSAVGSNGSQEQRAALFTSHPTAHMQQPSSIPSGAAAVRLEAAAAAALTAARAPVSSALSGQVGPPCFPELAAAVNDSFDGGLEQEFYGAGLPAAWGLGDPAAVAAGEGCLDGGGACAGDVADAACSGPGSSSELCLVHAAGSGLPSGGRVKGSGSCSSMAAGHSAGLRLPQSGRKGARQLVAACQGGGGSSSSSSSSSSTGLTHNA